MPDSEMLIRARAAADQADATIRYTLDTIDSERIMLMVRTIHGGLDRHIDAARKSKHGEGGVAFLEACIARQWVEVVLRRLENEEPDDAQ